MEEDEVEDTWQEPLFSKNMIMVSPAHDLPFNTSRTWVVSAKISRKYSGGVLRGSIPAMTQLATKPVGVGCGLRRLLLVEGGKYCRKYRMEEQSVSKLLHRAGGM